MPVKDMILGAPGTGRHVLLIMATAALFATCAFLGLAAIWKCGQLAHEAFKLPLFLAAVYTVPWDMAAGTIAVTSVLYGLLVSVLFATGKGETLSSPETCVLVVLAAAALASPIFSMYIQYLEILHSLAPKHIAAKMFSGLIAPITNAAVIIYALGFILPCTIVGAMGTQRLAEFCEKHIWTTHAPHKNAIEGAGKKLSSARYGYLVLGYVACVGLIFAALVGSVHSKMAYAGKIQMTFSTGSPEDTLRFMDRHSPDLFKVYGPSPDPYHFAHSPLYWAATNQNFATFVAVTERAPVTSQQAIHQYLEIFADALEKKDIPKMERIAHIYSMKTCTDVPEVVHGRLSTIAQSMAKAVQHTLFSEADMRAVLRACATMEVFTPKLASTIWEPRFAGVLSYLHAEGWLPAETIDALLARSMNSSCDARIVDELLNLGANTRQWAPPFPAVPDKDVCPLLANALLYCKDRRVSERLFAAGADPQATCVDGRTIPELFDDHKKAKTWLGRAGETIEQRRALLDEFLEKAMSTAH